MCRPAAQTETCQQPLVTAKECALQGALQLHVCAHAKVPPVGDKPSPVPILCKIESDASSGPH